MVETTGNGPQSGIDRNRTYISFSADIDATTTEGLIAVLANCANEGVREVYLMLSTPGGTVSSGMTLYNTLRAMPFRLITHNMGNVDSIGNAIFLAGEERYACPHSTFMFHGVGFEVPTGQRFEEKALREHLDSILSDSRRIGAIIAGRTKIDSDEIAKFFQEARTVDAAYAASHGIIDEIRDLLIPPGSGIITLTFPRW